MEENRELGLAWELVERTGVHVFLTGKAGTGKTTFLKRLRDEGTKRMVVLAPTGIAAINAGGMTLHSFFQLPFAPYIPDTSFTAGGGAQAARYFRFSREKKNIIRSMDLLVIDEISMVRADLLDSVDSVLRRFRDRSKPFGGVQLLMIGDLQQLAPVVKDEEWEMLKTYYDTPYFFSSTALSKTEFCTVELRKVYRQSDSRFLDLLNSIRDGSCGKDVLKALNERYIPDFHPKKEDGYIHLVTHNLQAQRINDREMDLLTGPSYSFQAVIEGKFPDYAYPADEILTLKKGAQVMFVKNDTSGEHRYVNGTIGEVTDISEDMIEVQCRDSGATYTIQQETWSNARYVLDEDTREIREEVEGTFRQYPLKPAWAITIHKSQGLTFDRAIIDARAAFAHGQTYVALSRCRTLEGLVLSSPLASRTVISDSAVEDFTRQSKLTEPDAERIGTLRRQYFLDLLTDLFDFSGIEKPLRKYIRTAEEHLQKLYPKQIAGHREALEPFAAEVTEVALKFRPQYTRMVESTPDGYASSSVLQERIRSGAEYFREKLEALGEIFNPDSRLSSDNKEIEKLLSQSMEEFYDSLRLRTALLEFTAGTGFETCAYLRKKDLLSIERPGPAPKKAKSTSEENKKAKEQKVEVPADILHPRLFSALVAWRRSEATARNVPAYVVLQQKALLGISNLLPQDLPSLLRVPYFGKAGAEKYGERILEMVKEYLSGGDSADNSVVDVNTEGAGTGFEE